MLLVDGLVYSFPKPQKLGHSSGSFSDDDHSHNIMRLTLRYEWYQLSVMIQTLFKLISYFHLSASHIASAGHLLNLSNFYVFSKKWNLEEEKKGRGWIWATSCEGSPGQQTKRTNVPAFMMKWMTMMENMNNLTTNWRWIDRLALRLAGLFAFLQWVQNKRPSESQSADARFQKLARAPHDSCPCPCSWSWSWSCSFYNIKFMLRSKLKISVHWAGIWWGRKLWGWVVVASAPQPVRGKHRRHQLFYSLSR